jgi:RNA-directed DNA polymerase
MATEKNNPTGNRAVPNGSVTYHRTMPPRQLSTLLRHGVSKAVFDQIDEHAWHRLVGWIYRKHNRLSWKQLKRRFCLPGSWTIAHNGVVFTGAASVAVTRYRYRGSTIPTPWTPNPATATSS